MMRRHLNADGDEGRLSVAVVHCADSAETEFVEGQPSRGHQYRRPVTAIIQQA